MNRRPPALVLAAAVLSLACDDATRPAVSSKTVFVLINHTGEDLHYGTSATRLKF